ncbi:MAG: NAD(P)-dependent alcohol dehydrogenase [Paludibacter sp.]|nr:NAD(P)-dependent alcohol dehydrogenase [Paludibacter sp.]
MKAVVYTKYGSPDVLQFKEVEKPVPKANEILIKIIATSVNRTDCGFRNPEYFIVRLVGGLFKPKRKILGSELAGEVEAIGKNVKTFKPGDSVFGLSTLNFGAHAEYICIPEEKSITTKPTNIPHHEAAAVCDGGFLALTNIKKINFTHKPNILINGASGSIGSASVQFAKYFGATVTAVCRTKDFELLKSLGADEVIDYTKEDFTENGQHYDVVIDAVGKSSFFCCRNILKPKGIYFSTELGYLSQNIFLALLTPLFGGKKVLFPIPKDTKEDIVFIKELMEKGKYKAVIDRVYQFEQIIEATRYVETGQKVGNVVITVNMN